MQLKPDTLLQGGKYKITRTLGQGGFGITYEAEQVLLQRRVAVKEFFMKDCCERGEDTCRVTVGTGSQRTLVEKFRGKFIKEAQMIAGMDHPHIVRVLDVFEENGTAYYVMDYLSGGSLADKVKTNGPLSTVKAEDYIRQVAGALAYIHSQNTVHLDVKPSNILLNAKDEAVLIDFGISKHYDDSGEQTSSTPVGISKGYAPLEQGRDGDVSQFGPSTDIYALGATLYYLITGIVPPEASIVNEDGLKRMGVSDRIWYVIEKSMQPRRKDRPQNISEFLSLLDNNVDDDESTVVYDDRKPDHHSKQDDSRKPKGWLWIILAITAMIGIIVTILLGKSRIDDTDIKQQDTVAVAPEPNPIEQIDSSYEEELYGSIRFTSTPPGASIWLDRKDTKKKTPDILTNVSPGKHSVRLVLDGYSENTKNVTVSPGEQVNLVFALKANDDSQSSSIIKAKSFKLEAYDNRDKASKNASDVKYFITSLTLIQNSLAKKGPLRVYVQIKGPNGEVLKNQWSRTFQVNEKSIFASASRELDYEGVDVDLSVYIKDFGDALPGVYTAYVYTEESFLGQTKIQLSSSSASPESTSESLQTQQAGNSSMVISNPIGAKAKDVHLSITQVRIQDNQTIIDFEFWNDNPDGGYYEYAQIDKNAHIVVDGKTYYLTKVGGIKITPEKTYFTRPNESLKFKLYFPSISKSAQSLDFIESSSSKWQIFNVQLK